MSITSQVCDGLGKAHTIGIIHRDIKPANILLNADHKPKLTDFGLARDGNSDSVNTMTGAMLGTIDFMSPEQRHNPALTDARSDLWSLAATFYQMVTGKSPRTIRIDEVPKKVQSFIGKALEDDPEQRYQNALEFRLALELCMKTEPRENIINGVLENGECPNCHIRNEINRKFCRECAEPLQVDCLNCSCKIQIWEKVCGECGVRQQKELENKEKEFELCVRNISLMIDGYDYEKAISIADRLIEIKDHRFLRFNSIGLNQKAKIELEMNEQHKIIQDKYSEAKTHAANYDYISAARTIEKLPYQLLSNEIKDACQKWVELQSESILLMNDIVCSVKTKNLRGLLFKVERIIEVCGETPKLVKLRDQLVARTLNLYKKSKEMLGKSERTLSIWGYDKSFALLNEAKYILEKLIEEDNFRNKEVVFLDEDPRLKKQQVLANIKMLQQTLKSEEVPLVINKSIAQENFGHKPRKQPRSWLAFVVSVLVLSVLMMFLSRVFFRRELVVSLNPYQVDGVPSKIDIQSRPSGKPVVKDKVNLLDLNLTEATLCGSWTRFGDKLRSSDQRSGLALPIPVPERFELHFTIRCIEGSGRFFVGLVKEGLSFLTIIEPSRVSIENVDERESVFEGKNAKRNRNWVGEYNCVLRVDGSNVILDIDGIKMINWRGDYSRLSKSPIQNMWGYINNRVCLYSDHFTSFEISDISIHDLDK